MQSSAPAHPPQRPDPAPAGAARSPRQVAGEPRRILRGARILLVEDNDINLELTLTMLEDAEVRVTTAQDGQEALAALALAEFDGVLMDCQMPVMDGYEASRRIRSEPRWRGLPILALTANALQGDRERALAAGMDDHIVKPLEADQLFEAMARWIAPAVAVGTAGVPAGADASASSGALPASLPGIDLAIARASTGGRDDLVGRLLLLFRDSQADAVPTFRQARSAGDLPQARRLAHTLASTAGSLGAMEVHACARALEDACEARADDAAVESLLVALQAALAPVMAGLARWPSPPGSSPPPAEPSDGQAMP